MGAAEAEDLERVLRAHREARVEAFLLPLTEDTGERIARCAVAMSALRQPGQPADERQLCGLLGLMHVELQRASGVALEEQASLPDVAAVMALLSPAMGAPPPAERARVALLAETLESCAALAAPPFRAKAARELLELVAWLLGDSSNVAPRDGIELEEVFAGASSPTGRLRALLRYAGFDRARVEHLEALAAAKSVGETREQLRPLAQGLAELLWQRALRGEASALSAPAAAHTPVGEPAELGWASEVLQALDPEARARGVQLRALLEEEGFAAAQAALRGIEGPHGERLQLTLGFALLLSLGGGVLLERLQPASARAKYVAGALSLDAGVERVWEQTLDAHARKVRSPWAFPGYGARAAGESLALDALVEAAAYLQAHAQERSAQETAMLLLLTAGFLWWPAALGEEVMGEGEAVLDRLAGEFDGSPEKAARATLRAALPRGDGLTRLLAALRQREARGRR